jgi:uncharacterized membrane protein
MLENRNIVSIVVALLGAAKLVLQAFGVQISDADINAVANAVAALVTLYGVIATHLRKDFPVNKQAQPPEPPSA